MPLNKEQKREYQKTYMQNRRKNKGLTKNPIIAPTIPSQDAPESTNPVRPDMLDPNSVRPNVRPDVIPNYGLPGCGCKHCQQTRTNKSDLKLNHGSYKAASQLSPGEINRVSLPGDNDYVIPVQAGCKL
jgi:hypothetical protein